MTAFQAVVIGFTGTMIGWFAVATLASLKKRITTEAVSSERAITIRTGLRKNLFDVGFPSWVAVWNCRLGYAWYAVWKTPGGYDEASGWTLRKSQAYRLARKATKNAA